MFGLLLPDVRIKWCVGAKGEGGVGGPGSAHTLQPLSTRQSYSSFTVGL